MIRLPWLCLCLSLLLATPLAAQQPLEVEVIVGRRHPRQDMQLPRLQLGLELSRPLHHQISRMSRFDRSLPLEAVAQLRLGSTAWYSQLYGGYFWGERHYSNGTQLQQRGYWLKPGILYVYASNTPMHVLTVEVNLLYSVGQLQADKLFYGPVFGDQAAETRHRYHVWGGELVVGMDAIRIGNYKLKFGARMALVEDLPDTSNPFYVPGAGYVGNSFIRLSGGLNLYLMRAMGHAQSN
ncbi:hypothetical protein [Cesiribacter andamanensis]|uniref:Outer membrane protein beta-barrel domain-containing protein n=1 Tax=Cesiribacter andamanensis AMV16 TaxID=1279009 RepID=M7MY85_9BACT|nr:hypothetical protein [Cesiribacter andamanensis]EMR01403.1 hypothetical protein ADICEAN_03463 [Cesiribacter andamanensis AMV16]